MNKRQHKKNFINKVYVLSLYNNYVVLEFDKDKIKPRELDDWARVISKRTKGNLIIIPNDIQIQTMNIADMKRSRDILNKQIEKWET